MCIRDSHIINTDNRDTINFRNYKRNPNEFLKRVEELIVKNRETRWTTVRGMLDEMFKETYDNWWTATRPDIQSIQEFKTQFKAKYWSESTQNMVMVRNNLSNGRYESQNRQSLTSYFLGKICMARNLEPRIPEECLVIQLSYNRCV